METYTINMRPVDLEEGMRKWTESGTPGPQHEWLARRIGTYEITMRTWMDPAAPPQETTGTSTIVDVMDGRFIEDTVTSTMMGKPFVTRNTMGFSHVQNQFVATSISSHSTDILTSVGALDRAGTRISFFGHMNEPMTGEINKPVRYDLTVLSDDEQRVEISEIVYGEPFKVVEIEYRRTT